MLYRTPRMITWALDTEEALREVQLAKEFEPEILFNERSKYSRYETLVSLRNLVEGYAAEELRGVDTGTSKPDIVPTDGDALGLYKKVKPAEGRPHVFRGLGKTKILLLGDYLRKKGLI